MNNLLLNNDNANVEELCEDNIDKLIHSTDKITTPFLSKFEKTKILGLRIQQLSAGAPSVLSKNQLKNLKSNIEIAEKELELKKTPFIIRRRLPNNKFEYWHIKDLIDISL